MITMRSVLSGHLVLALMLASFGAIPASADAATAGDLITCPDTQAVYYYSSDGSRWVFPNENTYFTWYSDFDTVVEITCDDLADLPIGELVTYQPGTRMVKIQSLPDTYVIEPGGVLRHIQSEAQAADLFGPDWNERIDDVSDAFWLSYTEGEALPENSYPDGTILYGETSNEHYYVENSVAREVPDHLMTGILIEHALHRSEPFTDAFIGLPMTESEWNNYKRADFEQGDVQEDPSASVTVDMQVGDFFFSESEIRVSQGGEVTVNFTEVDGTHTFTIDELGVNVLIEEGGSTSFTADLAPGEYFFYCDIDNHRELGMEGTLIVEGN